MIGGFDLGTAHLRLQGWSYTGAYGLQIQPSRPNGQIKALRFGSETGTVHVKTNPLTFQTEYLSRTFLKTEEN